MYCVACSSSFSALLKKITPNPLLFACLCLVRAASSVRPAPDMLMHLLLPPSPLLLSLLKQPSVPAS
jgi:hypothetical protein